jgi:hypothetical protein
MPGGTNAASARDFQNRSSWQFPRRRSGQPPSSAVQIPRAAVQKEQRNRARFAESAVGVTDAIGLDKLCGDRFVCVIAHRLSPSNLILIGPERS